MSICYVVPGTQDQQGSIKKGSCAPAFTEDQPPQTQLTEVQKVYGFSQFWKEVSYNFAHWEKTGNLEWDKAYQDSLPRRMQLPE